MEEKYIKPLKALNYASLKDQEETKLRDFEKKFNEEFGTEYYFMVMKRD